LELYQNHNSPRQVGSKHHKTFLVDLIKYGYQALKAGSRNGYGRSGANMRRYVLNRESVAAQ